MSLDEGVHGLFGLKGKKQVLRNGGLKEGHVGGGKKGGGGRMATGVSVYLCNT